MKFEIYKDAKGEWRWRLKANGRIVADSGEGYKTRAGCRSSITRLQSQGDLLRHAAIVQVIA